MTAQSAGRTRVPVTQIARLIRGVTYSKEQACNAPQPGKIGILRASNIGDFRLALDDLVYVPRVCVDEEQMLRAGDVLVATSSGSASVAGKAAPVTEPLPYSFGAFCGVLRPSAVVEPRYFQRYFQTREYRQAASEAARGVNINNLKRSHFDSFEMPVPSAREQKEIADKLDALLPGLDVCRARLGRVPEHLRRFREAVLEAAVSGRLTQPIGVGAAETVGIELGDEKIQVPADWGRTELDACIDATRPLCYGVVQPGAEDEAGVHLVRVQDIERGAVDKSALRTVSRAVDQEYRRSRVCGGDVLISIVGTIGRTALVPRDLDANIARAIARIAPRREVLGRWIQIWLDTPSVQWWLLRSSKEVARKTLNLGDLARLPIAVPTHAEQAEIVRRVDELFSLADNIERRYEAAVAKIEKLTPAILAKAFRGELVPQVPEDAPAQKKMLESVSGTPKSGNAAAEINRRSGRRSRTVRT